jgi:two-component system response regulator HydG
MAKDKIVIVDDDEFMRDSLMEALSRPDLTVVGFGRAADALDAVSDGSASLLLTDMRMPEMDGMQLLLEAKRLDPQLPVVMMTAFATIETAVEAMKRGAFDYMMKPFKAEEIELVVNRALEHHRLVTENQYLKDELAKKFRTGDFVGKSPAMKAVFEEIRAAAPSSATVFIRGESGTGKELVARLLHRKSPRAAGPFVTVNCAALSETLLESELYGHEKGAFTGADKRREGRFRAADTGSIFLDEIGEMPTSMQAKLLRAIQEREIQRVGGDRPLKVDVRIIAATNRDLAGDVEAGRFRPDLYYRLNVVSLCLPPLRERVEDIPPLAEHFLRVFAEKNGKRVKGFTPGAMDRLLKHEWPGNVRELENTVERSVVLLLGEYVSERELPPGLPGGDAPFGGAARGGWNEMTLEEIERSAVREVLEKSGGNKSEAARRLGITRKTLLSKLRGEGE